MLNKVFSHYVLLLIVNLVLLFVEFSFFKWWGTIIIVLFDDRWHAVASWTWDAQDETCGICRMAFDGCCSDCKLPGDDCPLSKSVLRVIMFGNTFAMVSHVLGHYLEPERSFYVMPCLLIVLTFQFSWTCLPFLLFSSCWTIMRTMLNIFAK